MDRHDRPTSAASNSEQPHLNRPSSSSRGPSPVPSHRSYVPATPGTEYGGRSDYFPPLAAAHSNATSLRSYVSRSRAASGAHGQSDGLDSLRQPSIRLRRMSGASSSRPNSQASFEGWLPSTPGFDGNRPRSLSQPERAHLSPEGVPARHSRRVQELALPRLTEEGNRPTMEELREARAGDGAPLSPATSLPERSRAEEQQGSHRRFPGRRFWPGFGRKQDRQDAAAPQTQAEAEYDEALVDWLDTIDPEVQTLSTLTNVQNSLFVPDLGSWVNRRPTYSLSQHQLEQHVPKSVLPPGVVPPTTRRPTSDASQLPVVDETSALPAEAVEPEAAAGGLRRSNTITSQLQDTHYAALPHGQSLEGWTAEEKWELDDHVRHMLHSRRSRMKRRLKGFGQYVSRPLGFLVTLYAVLITLFGLAWVLFMIGWIYVGDRQEYIIHVVDSVLVALFAIMGDGLAPFRAMDTYRLFFIVRYTRIIERAKKGKFPRPRSRLQKQNIPPEVKESIDLAVMERTSSGQAPGQAATPRRSSQESNAAFPPFDETNNDLVRDLEEAKSDTTEDWLSVLTPKQRKRLIHHKKKMAKSHSFYKPQETFTHFAFPLSYLIAIVLLLDLHSCLQISLGATTWGIDYRTRNPAITTTILCLSITANITAGLVISRGDKISRKKDVVKLLDRQALTGDAIKHLEKRRREESGGEDLSRGSSTQKTDGKEESSGSEGSKDGSTGTGTKLKKTMSPEGRTKLVKKSLAEEQVRA